MCPCRIRHRQGRFFPAIEKVLAVRDLRCGRFLGQRSPCLLLARGGLVNPRPPHTKSLPWRALTRSCPRPATMMSWAAVPTSWSLPLVPTIVAMCPKHVGATAADAVPVTARAAIAKTAARTTRFVVGFTTFLFGRRGSRLDDARKTNAATNTPETLARWSTKVQYPSARPKSGCYEGVDAASRPAADHCRHPRTPPRPEEGRRSRPRPSHRARRMSNVDSGPQSSILSSKRRRRSGGTSARAASSTSPVRRL